MKDKFKILKRLAVEHKGFIFSLFVVALTSYIFKTKGNLIQDDYPTYVINLKNADLQNDFYNSRLYPGYPILILIFNLIFKNIQVSALIIVFISFILSYYFLYKITKSNLSWIPLIFPPMMLSQAAKIANEFILISMIIACIYFFMNKKYLLSSALCGLMFLLRPTGSLIFIALIATLFIKKRKIKLNYFLVFLIPFVFLTIFNKIYFDALNPFFQLTIYPQISLSGNAIGFLQIFKDLLRSLIWKQFRIFLSGLFYLSLIALLLKLSIKKKLFNNQDYLFILFSIILILFFVLSYRLRS